MVCGGFVWFSNVLLLLSPNRLDILFLTAAAVVVTVVDEKSGLESKTIYYAWDTSSTVEPSVWNSAILESDGTITVKGERLNGTYYLWIREVSDKAGNTHSDKVGFTFDDTIPEIETVTIVSDNDNPNQATVGDTVTVTITASEQIYTVPTTYK